MTTDEPIRMQGRGNKGNFEVSPVRMLDRKLGHLVQAVKTPEAKASGVLILRDLPVLFHA